MSTMSIERKEADLLLLESRRLAVLRNVASAADECSHRHVNYVTVVETVRVTPSLTIRRAVRVIRSHSSFTNQKAATTS